MPIVEDDPYALLPRQREAPIATLVPELTTYVTGLSSASVPGRAPRMRWRRLRAMGSGWPAPC